MRRDFASLAGAVPTWSSGGRNRSARRVRHSPEGSVLLRAAGWKVDRPAGPGAEYARTAHTVLRCSATESESHLPFLALADLLGLVLDDVSDGLPAAQRTALESALTGRGESTLQRDGLALRLAVLSRCARSRRGARPRRRRRPAVARPGQRGTPRLRRPPPGRHPGTAAVRGAHGRTGDRGRGVRPPSARVPAGHPRGPPRPADPRQVSTLLDERGYAGLPRSTVRDIHRTSGGNPLFALELGRALAETPPRCGRREPLPVPDLAARPGPVPAGDAVGRGAAHPPGRERRCPPHPCAAHAAGRENAEAETAQAATLGLLATDPEGPTVQFAHPADLGRAVRRGTGAGAAGGARRAVHGGLRPDRARPAPGPGHHRHRPEVAARLRRPPRCPGTRGAPSVAASLGLLAARHTPADSAPGPDERRLTAAEDAITAGEPDLARDIAREVLTRTGVPGERVRAWMVVIEAAGQAIGEVDAVFPQALADAGDDPRLLAWSTTSWPGAHWWCRATSRRAGRRPRTRPGWRRGPGTGAPKCSRSRSRPRPRR